MSGPAALRVAEGPAGVISWEQLMQRDVWRQSELPHGDLVSGYRCYRRIRFDHISRPWLRATCKVWAKDMLMAGRTPETVAVNVAGIAAFDRWIDCQPQPVSGPSGLTRELIEAYLLYLRTSGLKGTTQLKQAGGNDGLNWPHYDGLKWPRLGVR